MPESGCWAADFSREAGKNACRGRPPGRPGGTVYETGSLGRICTEARRGFAQFPSGEDFAGRRGRRPLRGDEGLCVGAALAAARAGKTWTKENRGRIRIQGMVRIRPRSFVEGRLRRAGRRGRRPLRHDESFCALSYYATGPSDCRQTYAAKHRHAWGDWGDCEGGMVVPPSRSIHAKMGTISEVPILAFQAVDTLSTA